MQSCFQKGVSQRHDLSLLTWEEGACGFEGAMRMKARGKGSEKVSGPVTAVPEDIHQRQDRTVIVPSFSSGTNGTAGMVRSIFLSQSIQVGPGQWQTEYSEYSSIMMFLKLSFVVVVVGLCIAIF
jgi:hypothetical protein